ncbi:MAG: hypothetical protein ACRCX2_04650 [Paraclostridium sp.]
MNRYFLVFLNGVNPDGSSFNSMFVNVTGDGRFVNRNYVLERMKELDKFRGNVHPGASYYITNIIELSELDYNDYIK